MEQGGKEGEKEMGAGWEAVREQHGKEEGNIVKMRGEGGRKGGVEQGAKEARSRVERREKAGGNGGMRQGGEEGGSRWRGGRDQSDKKRGSMVKREEAKLNG